MVWRGQGGDRKVALFERPNAQQTRRDQDLPNQQNKKGRSFCIALFLTIRSAGVVYQAPLDPNQRPSVEPRKKVCGSYLRPSVVCRQV